ncbi:MAG: glycoside hydrolase family 3 N-terminal domain-containing protein [Bacteroidales bacterium]|jgi:beta-glucosidase
MKKTLGAILILSGLACSVLSHCFIQGPDISNKVDSLLKIMTLEEKIGQLNQYNDDWEATGPVLIDSIKRRQVIMGGVGSILNCNGAARTRKWQESAMKSRLRIPLLFGQDVIHGYRTTFPIPLAEACSWDMKAIELSARIAAEEASAAGIHWTFAPMLDISRDPRWGRVMEGAGEDPCLASRIGYARVTGFQGRNLGDTNSLMACAKHFVAYGAAIGGRDYNSVDMSEKQLWETYLPPFKAALDAGVATFMCGFNDLNGIPCTGNKCLLNDILKRKWKFTGFVVSDWGSVGQMVNHGVAKDQRDAALLALKAGCDMDMESGSYKTCLSDLIKNGDISMEQLEKAVRRILQKKFELGLFDDPFKYSDQERENRQLKDSTHVRAARNMACRSIVLLKNQGHLLPLSKKTRTIALIGPLMKEIMQNKGAWDIVVPGIDSSDVVSQFEGIRNKVDAGTKLLYAKGCNIDGQIRDGFAEAVNVARQADVVILSIGERRDMSGESRSRSNINIPGVQEELLKAIKSAGKPVVVLVNSGRPLVFNYTVENATAILYTWWLGSEAGNAIADVIFGDYNPSAKLTITFPRSVGQIPIYYNHLNTGHPPTNDTNRMYSTAYQDLSIYPEFEFGYGLSYTDFSYSNLHLDKKKIKSAEKLQVSFTIANTGKFDGEEIIQLHLCDRVASVARPVQELKDFQKVKLKAGESRDIYFTIDKEKLSFYNGNLNWVAEPGEFDVMIGSSSRDIRLKTSFELVE